MSLLLWSPSLALSTKGNRSNLRSYLQVALSECHANCVLSQLPQLISKILKKTTQLINFCSTHVLGCLAAFGCGNTLAMWVWFGEQLARS